VALIAEYLKAVSDDREVPIATDDDPRWEEIAAESDDDDDWDEDDEENERDEDEPPPPQAKIPKTPSRSKKPGEVDWDDKIERHIRSKSKGELETLAWSLVKRFPEIYQEFRERLALQEGDVDQLVAETRREIRAVTSEPAGTEEWDDEGNIPDYSKVQRRFERLLELGHADAVVDLGREFLREGQKQVNEAHDEEGEVGEAFAKTLPVIFQAVLRSSLSGPERILFAIDTVMHDDHDHVAEAADPLFEAATDPKDWSAVADTLMARLAPAATGKASGSISEDYLREQLTSWIAEALENADRVDELQALYESEARATRKYDRIVRFHLNREQFEDAERWAREGIVETIENSPGLSDQLAATLGQIAEKRKQWDVVAAHVAHKFLDGYPSANGFDELIQAAKKAKVEEPVREAALRFLETGERPYRVSVSLVRPKGKAGSTPAPATARLQVDPSWPLPVPNYLIPILSRPNHPSQANRPHLDVLLSMAIAAKDSEAILRWFDKMGADGQSGGSISYADKVAEAVAETHPERSLAIYTAKLNARLPEAHSSAYETSAGYLRKLRPIYEALGRVQEWDALVASIREKYRNRPRFIEQLDRLNPRPIVQESKPPQKG
jgi:uncharacterized Zn finger protein